MPAVRGAAAPDPEVVAVGVTPMYGGGLPMSADQAEGNPFLWSGSGYVVLAVLVAQASLVLGWCAVRPGRRTDTSDRPLAGVEA